ncbi:DUF413 domain-containing protein [Aliikangiella maris]|uniref:DUF413 domain-containing protein n=2 Tax=Aliikangiella maris TaxID=3162458 RepID=A0ABV2BVB2_9GAMM
MQTREFWLQKKFSDIAKFPYGFSRSGDFTIAQSMQLESNGNLIRALLNGEVSDPTDSDIELKNAIISANRDYSELAKIWIKYAGTHRSKISVSSSSSKNEFDESDSDWVSDEVID